MMRADTLEIPMILDGMPATVRVSRDVDGELHLGSPEATTLVEQLLVYELGEDTSECSDLLQVLRAVGTGTSEPVRRAWNVTKLSIGPVSSTLELLIEGADEPVEVSTRDLHDAVARYRDFLAATDA